MEKNILPLADERKVNPVDVFTLTSGAWKRSETPDETVAAARGACKFVPPAC